MKWTTPMEQANLPFCIWFDYKCLNGHKNPPLKYNAGLLSLIHTDSIQLTNSGETLLHHQHLPFHNDWAHAQTLADLFTVLYSELHGYYYHHSQMCMDGKQHSYAINHTTAEKPMTNYENVTFLREKTHCGLLCLVKVACVLYLHTSHFTYTCLENTWKSWNLKIPPLI